MASKWIALLAMLRLLLLAFVIQLSSIPLAVSQSNQSAPAARSEPIISPILAQYPVNMTLNAPITTLIPREPRNVTDAAGLMARIGHRLLYTIGFYGVRNTSHAAWINNEWIAPRSPFQIHTTQELVQVIRTTFLQRYATGPFRGIVYPCLKAGSFAEFITWRTTVADNSDGAAASVLNSNQPDRLRVKVLCIEGVRLNIDAATVDFNTGLMKPTASPLDKSGSVIVTSGDGSVSRDATTGSLQIKPQSNGTAISSTSILFPNVSSNNNSALNGNTSSANQDTNGGPIHLYNSSMALTSTVWLFTFVLMLL
ncbi:hypothetical protein BDF19DRAFT_448754 [Syncephalis fuscata]|nr:hypothetical protein BDF19DRAFT_448754 [Syncephalis fuscata]